MRTLRPATLGGPGEGVGVAVGDALGVGEGDGLSVTGRFSETGADGSCATAVITDRINPAPAAKI